MYDDSPQRDEPKSAAIYNYDPKDEDTIMDDFDMQIQRERAFSKVSMNDNNLY